MTRYVRFLYNHEITGNQYLNEQARKAQRCDRNLQSETMNDWLTDPLTDRGRCWIPGRKSYRILEIKSLWKNLAPPPPPRPLFKIGESAVDRLPTTGVLLVRGLHPPHPTYRGAILPQILGFWHPSLNMDFGEAPFGNKAHPSYVVPRSSSKGHIQWCGKVEYPKKSAQ